MFSIIVVKTGEVVDLADSLDAALDLAKEKSEEISREGQVTNCDCCGPQYPSRDETEVAVEGDGMKYRFVFSSSGYSADGSIQEKYENGEWY